MNPGEHRAAHTDKPASNGEAVAALFDAALGHLRAGRHLDAQLCCQQVLALDPEHADTLHLMGLLCLHGKQFDHAVAWLSRAIAREPKTLYLTTLGTALLQQGRRDEALKAFDAATQLRPGDADLWCNRALALNELKRPGDAIASFQHALKLDPRHHDAANKAAQLLHHVGRFDEALVYFDRCDELQPNQFQTLHQRAGTLQKLRRFEEALADRHRAHAADPTNADGCVGLGNSFASLGRYEEALPWFDRALALRENVAHGLRSKAIALEQLGRLSEASDTYRRASLVNSNEAESEWNLALLKLLRGDFEAGWAGREAARWKIPTLVALYPKLSRPLWRGVEPIEGKTVLVCPDEGLGDVIQFARYVPMLAARGARVILGVQDELFPLLSGLPGVSHCVPRSVGTVPAYDFHCPITSLPFVFATRLDSIPAARNYLPPPPADRVATWEARLGPRDRMRVGLCWSGNPQHNNDRNRSVPFSTLARILDADATFVSLQKAVRAEDMAPLRTRNDIVDLTGQLTDFAETAALVACLDLVITVDTSVAHLAAAQGRPTWVLLPYAPDYRWLLDREDSPWYPSVRLFRQDASRDYAGVIERVRGKLIAELTKTNARL
jgi:tetratricopeptide (TPR) repeat protein